MFSGVENCCRMPPAASAGDAQRRTGHRGEEVRRRATHAAAADDRNVAALFGHRTLRRQSTAYRMPHAMNRRPCRT
jgi:hypothetical protein